MSIRTIATLGVALLLGLVAVLLVRGYLGSAQKNNQAAGALSTVVVAAQPISRGVALQPAMLKLARFPVDSVPPGSFRTVAEAVGGGAPRLALQSLAANEPLLAAHISGPGARQGLSAVLAAGMRAVSVRSGDVAGVAGFVLPGDRVDILLTRNFGSGDNGSTVTQMLAEDVRVIGVDQIADENTDKPVVAKAVTVEVTPAQAQSISLGQAVGTVSLALRPITPDTTQQRAATTVSDLGVFAAPRGAPKPATGPTAPAKAGDAKPRLGRNMIEVRVTRGTESSGYPVRRN